MFEAEPNGVQPDVGRDVGQSFELVVGLHGASCRYPRMWQPRGISHSVGVACASSVVSLIVGLAALEAISINEFRKKVL